jgi:hypothetical protein
MRAQVHVGVLWKAVTQWMAKHRHGHRARHVKECYLTMADDA